MNKVLISGNEAIAKGAYECGVVFASAYPGTPSTEIIENIAQYKEIYSEWSPNEKVAYEVAYGASLAGGRALVVMKHVGLNVASDPLMTSAYTGINAGLVIVSADDPGQHSSQNEQDNRRFAFFAKIPCIEPTDSQEAKDFLNDAFEISEQFDIPVLFRITTRISHSKSPVILGTRKEIPIKEYKSDPKKYCMIPAFSRPRRIDLEKRIEKLKEFSNNFKHNKVEMRSPKIGIITSGISYQYVKEVFNDASILKIVMSNPIPDKLIQEFSKSVEKLYVIEELEPYIEEHVKMMGIPVIGKTLIPSIGELNPDIIRSSITGEKIQTKIPEIPNRPPILCPGCPHRGFFVVVKKMRLIPLGDIGCYTLSCLPPLNSHDTCLCMGASIGQAIGFSKVYKDSSKNKILGILGDSTFVHSGITPLIDALYNKANIVICILDNGTTAMTGHQENPTTGKTIHGENTNKLDLEKLCQTLGVTDVQVVNPIDLKQTEEALKKSLNFIGTSVIIFRSPCIIKFRSTWKEPLKVEKEKCIKCGACIRVGCPAITKDIEGKSEINNLLCIGCTVCSQVCKQGAIS